MSIYICLLFSFLSLFVVSFSFFPPRIYIKESDWFQVGSDGIIQGHRYLSSSDLRFSANRVTNSRKCTGRSLGKAVKERRGSSLLPALRLQNCTRVIHGRAYSHRGLFRALEPRLVYYLKGRSGTRVHQRPPHFRCKIPQFV